MEKAPLSADGTQPPNLEEVTVSESEVEANQEDDPPSDDDEDIDHEAVEALESCNPDEANLEETLATAAAKEANAKKEEDEAGTEDKDSELKKAEEDEAARLARFDELLNKATFIQEKPSQVSENRQLFSEYTTGVEIGELNINNISVVVAKAAATKSKMIFMKIFSYDASERKLLTALLRSKTDSQQVNDIVEELAKNC